ncbi:MAG TPA: outer membrane beta-barrel protein [Vicinamibacterales bacterium]
MMRFARVVSCVLFGLLAMSARGQAQTPGASDTSKFYVEFETGASLGHKSSGFYGGEAGYRVWRNVAVFAEVGHQGNVGTSDLDAKAKTVADAVGATSDASYKITYYDFGARYTPEITFGMVHPYAIVGFGGASVTAQTNFIVNGSVVPPESLGIQTGSDLDGTVNKGYFMIGGGVTYAFGKRYFVDGSFRYGYVMKSSEIDSDSGISTVRASIGVGVTF